MAKIPPQFVKKGKKKTPPKKGGGDMPPSDMTGQMMSMSKCMDSGKSHEECMQAMKKGGKMPPMKNMKNM